MKAVLAGRFRGKTRDEWCALLEGTDQVLAFCSDVGTKDRHSTSLETLKYMVAAGEGFTLIPALAAETGRGVRFSPLPMPDFARDIALVWRRATHERTNFAASQMPFERSPHSS